jgi:DNA-binding transcriptional regulator YdaS (Cro superfamily)
MELGLYLYIKKKSITDFSKELGCSREHLNKVINGQRKPSKILANAIEKATHGEVKVEDLIKPSNEAH